MPRDVNQIQTSAAEGLLISIDNGNLTAEPVAVTEVTRHADGGGEGEEEGGGEAELDEIREEGRANGSSTAAGLPLSKGDVGESKQNGGKDLLG